MKKKESFTRPSEFFLMNAVHQSSFPRALIIMEEPFNNVCGAGITVSNLFTGWPKERIASIYWSPMDPESDVCELHYVLRSERRWVFPLNHLLPDHRSAEKKTGAPANEPAITEQAPGENPGARLLTTVARKVWRYISRTIGGTEFLLRTELSAELTGWIGRFKPDIIYCAPTNYAVISLVDRIVRLTGASLIIHVFDDWPSVGRRGGMLQPLYGIKTNRAFCRLLEMAAYRLTIGEEMCAEYESRYGMKFLSFHNCPDPSMWVRTRAADVRVKPAFVFRFIGVLYPHGNIEAIMELAAAMEFLRKMDVEAVFEIYTDPGSVGEFGALFTKMDRVSVSEVPDDSQDVASLYAGADALVIAYDFNEFSSNRFRFSIPTKFPSYLLSAAPMLIYAPATLAVTQRCVSHGIAYVIDDHCPAQELSARLAGFIADPALRRSIADRGQRYAIGTMSADVIRPVFRKTMHDAMRHTQVG